MARRGRQTGSGGGVWKRHFPEAVFHRGLTPRTRAPPQGPKRPKTPHLLIPSHWGLGLRHTSFGGDTRGLQHVHSERVRTCVCFSSGQHRPEVDLCNDRTLTVTTIRTRSRSVTTRTPPARLYLALAATLSPPPTPAVTTPLPGFAVPRPSCVTFGAGVSHSAPCPRSPPSSVCVPAACPLFLPRGAGSQGPTRHGPRHCSHAVPKGAAFAVTGVWCYHYFIIIFLEGPSTGAHLMLFL